MKERTREREERQEKKKKWTTDDMKIHGIEFEERYPVLCPPWESRAILELHDWIPENLLTVTLFPLGAYPPLFC